MNAESTAVWLQAIADGDVGEQYPENETEAEMGFGPPQEETTEAEDVQMPQGNDVQPVLEVPEQPQEPALKCMICYDPIVTSQPAQNLALECGHTFHSHCLEQTWRTARKPRGWCPYKCFENPPIPEMFRRSMASAAAEQWWGDDDEEELYYDGGNGGSGMDEAATESEATWGGNEPIPQGEEADVVL